LNTLLKSDLALFENSLQSNILNLKESIPLQFSHLFKALEYSLQNGGKRLRPLLVLNSAEFLGLKKEAVLPLAIAIEFIHTYSLIHDDLPALDNDNYRRGQLTCHKKFGEATAILAGDALLTEAFYQLLPLQKNGFKAEGILEFQKFLVDSVGIRGMVGGQSLDILLEKGEHSAEKIAFINRHKTGALILACTYGVTFLIKTEKAKNLKTYGEAIGEAFQISDDLLDSAPTIEYANSLKNRLNDLIETAVQSVQGSESLVSIARWIQNRTE
jgi:geranylgeranyl diphosphate synthase type II